MFLASRFHHHPILWHSNALSYHQDNSIYNKTASILNEGSTPNKRGYHKEEECSLFVAFFTFLSYGVLLMLGYVREFFVPVTTKEKNREVRLAWR